MSNRDIGMEYFFACSASRGSFPVYGAGSFRYWTSFSFVQNFFFPCSVGPSCVPAPSIPWHSPHELTKRWLPLADFAALAPSPHATASARENPRITPRPVIPPFLPAAHSPRSHDFPTLPADGSRPD